MKYRRLFTNFSAYLKLFDNVLYNSETKQTCKWQPPAEIRTEWIMAPLEAFSMCILIPLVWIKTSCSIRLAHKSRCNFVAFHETRAILLQTMPLYYPMCVFVHWKAHIICPILKGDKRATVSNKIHYYSFSRLKDVLRSKTIFNYDFYVLRAQVCGRKLVCKSPCFTALFIRISRE